MKIRLVGTGAVVVAAVVVAIASGSAVRPSAPAAGTLTAATKQHALAAYGKLPLAFTANAGQTDPRVRYSAQGAGLSVFLTRREAMLALQRPGKQGKGREWRSRSASSARTGTSPSAASARSRAGSTTCSGTTLPSGTPACAPTSASSTAISGRAWTWPSPGESGKLKYEFLVRPGARVAGHQARLPRREAALARPARKPARPHTARRPRRRAPRQLPAHPGEASARRQQLRAQPERRRLRLLPRPRIRPPLPACNRPRPRLLQILGGTSEDRGLGISVDGAGSAYVTGVTSSADFPTTAGAFEDDLQRRQRRRLRHEARPERRCPGLLHVPGRKRRRCGQRHRARRQRQRLPHRLHRLDRLPDDRGRLRRDLQRRLHDVFVTKLDCGRHGPSLLQLPGRRRRRPGLRHRSRQRWQRSRHRFDRLGGLPDDRRRLRRDVQRRRRRLRHEARRERRRPRLLHLPGRKQRRLRPRHRSRLRR